MNVPKCPHCGAEIKEKWFSHETEDLEGSWAGFVAECHRGHFFWLWIKLEKEVELRDDIQKA